MQKLRNVLMLFTITILLATSLHAEQGFISVAVNSSKEVSKAVGLVFNGQETVQVAASDVVRANDNLVLVQFPYEMSELQTQTMASASVLNNDGSLDFGVVKALSVPGPKDSFYTLPVCQEAPPNPALQAKMSTIEQLIKVRNKIRRNRAQQLTALLDKATTEQILKLEQGFGLSNDQTIDVNEHPLVLIERFSRLHDAVKNYRIHRDSEIAAKRGL